MNACGQRTPSVRGRVPGFTCRWSFSPASLLPTLGSCDTEVTQTASGAQSVTFNLRQQGAGPQALVVPQQPCSAHLSPPLSAGGAGRAVRADWEFLSSFPMLFKTIQRFAILTLATFDVSLLASETSLVNHWLTRTTVISIHCPSVWSQWRDRASSPAGCRFQLRSLLDECQLPIRNTRLRGGTRKCCGINTSSIC